MTSDSLWSAFFPPVGGGPSFGPVAAPSRPRPPPTDPLAVITWYLESPTDLNCVIHTPLAQFELHQYEFVPFRQALERTRAPLRSRAAAAAAAAQDIKFPIVSLAMVNCVQRAAGVPPGALEAGHPMARAAYEADCDLRLTVVKHVLKEMLRLQKWQALMVVRVNKELGPVMDPIYHKAIPDELNKLQPQIRPVTIEPKHKSMQIVIERSSKP